MAQIVIDEGVLRPRPHTNPYPPKREDLVRVIESVEHILSERQEYPICALCHYRLRQKDISGKEKKCPICKLPYDSKTSRGLDHPVRVYRLCVLTFRNEDEDNRDHIHREPTVMLLADGQPICGWFMGDTDNDAFRAELYLPELVVEKAIPRIKKLQREGDREKLNRALSRLKERALDAESRLYDIADMIELRRMGTWRLHDEKGDRRIAMAMPRAASPRETWGKAMPTPT